MDARSLGAALPRARKKIDSLILGWVRIAPGGNNDGFERLARRIE
jgi:hypothetical protein